MHETCDHLRIIQKFKIFEVKLNQGQNVFENMVPKKIISAKKILMFHYQVVYFTRNQSVLNFSICLQNVSKKVTKIFYMA